MNIKAGLHPKNKHKQDYDFQTLVKSYPKLLTFIYKNKFGNTSIDFSNPEAVKALNGALLKHFYHIDYWEIPSGYLCPPIPGRADYIHHIAELVGPITSDSSIFDIGVGANCIYPLLAYQEYHVRVVGSDIDQNALANAQNIIKQNKLEHAIELRLQTDRTKIFHNIIKTDEKFSVCISNPPFHLSAAEAKNANAKKNSKLKIKSNSLNFGGKNNELWCEGGEKSFISQMIRESVIFKNNFIWFSSLVSKSETLPLLYAELKMNNIKKVKTIDMAQGQKKSRILAWSFY